MRAKTSPGDLLRFWVTLERPVGRGDYLRHGLALAVVKYGVDAALVYVATGMLWTPWSYLLSAPVMLGARFGGAPAWLAPVLVVWTLPFLWIGFALTLRRALDAGASAWLALLFFVPLASYAMMAGLCLAPTSTRGGGDARDGGRTEEGRRLPSALLSMAVGTALGLGMMLFAVQVLSTYGLALFMGTPFVVGVVTAFLFCRSYPASTRETLEVVTMTSLLVAGAAFVLGTEGVVCLLMVLPLGLGVAWMGAVAGRWIAGRDAGSLRGAGLAIALLPMTATLEDMEAPATVREVVTSVEIDAPTDVVWEHVVAFPPLAEPDELLFRLGVAYPMRAEVRGEGTGAVRYCVFSTGAFVEPITAWEPGRRLSFDVVESPPPLRELTPHRIAPPHLEGYLAPRRGEFRLVPLADGRTRLEGSTWYEQRLRPEGYWALFSDVIIGAIHRRVLDHIGAMSEAAASRGAVLQAMSTASRAADTLPRGLWVDATDALLDPTAEWSNKVELADLDGDGLLDLLFANGGNYSEPGAPEANRVFLNRGPGQRFEERTHEILGPTPDLARVIKARDLDGDGSVDVFVGATYQTQSRLYLGTGAGGFQEVTATHLPQIALSVGDAEPGDVDGDGDLDLVLADWGPGNNMTNAGGRTRLWLNEGGARFRDATEGRLPATLVRFSWDLELADVDNDHDLDVLVSCKRCPGSLLFRNDGSGVFAEDPRGLPQYTNNYELEPMDLDGDGFLDLVTINDGEIVGGVGSSRREHVFINDGEGRFRDRTDLLWPASENIGEDDNMVAFLDFDSDGDADFLIGSLSGPDRLLINDGTGRLTVATEVFSGAATPGTLGIALGDLDGDGRLDVVQAQGEVRDAEQERIYLGRGLEADTAPPVVTNATALERIGALLVRARVHDRKTPTLDTEWRHVEVRWTEEDGRRSQEMRWYGELLWSATVPATARGLEICAADAAGNEVCGEVRPGG